MLKHLAIIMDGNGRWAKLNGLKRTKGHQKGAEVVRDIATYCAKSNEIDYLTLYAFSTENWKRPQSEVDFLMKLIDKYLKQELKTYKKNEICFRVIGDISKFNKKLQNRINHTINETKDYKNLTLTLALNYGSYDEITRAVNRIKTKEIITTQDITNALDTSDFPSVDMLIRTGGEIRLSNFLLWQSAYAELFFVDTLWPNFTSKELDMLVDKFNSRNRRFGGL